MIRAGLARWLVFSAVVSILQLPQGIAASAPGSIDSLLREAYGSEAAAAFQGYIREEDLSREESAAVREAVKLIAGAGYPAECAGRYLKAAAELAEAGIGSGDLTNKIREGIAKGVDAGRLVHVLDMRAEALKDGKGLALRLEREGVRFVDRQMVYTVFADYLLRGVNAEDLIARIRDGNLKEYPALENLMR